MIKEKLHAKNKQTNKQQAINVEELCSDFWFFLRSEKLKKTMKKTVFLVFFPP